MKTTDSGFLFKVIGGSDNVEAKTSPGGKDTAYALAALRPYFVICEEDQFYKVTNLPAQTVEQAEAGQVGYVPKHQVHPWSTREALDLSAQTFGGGLEIPAWDDRDSLRKFLDSGDMKLGPPAYRESLESALKREHARRPYPVLGSTIEKLRGTVDKRVFNVLLPAELQPDAKLVVEPDALNVADAREVIAQKIDRAMTRTTITFAFDATSDMELSAADMARQVERVVAELPQNIRDAMRIGFVFFRDETDEEKYVIVKPQNVAGAVGVLARAARPGYMIGGGDPPEPLLDAVYIAHHLYPWSEGNVQGGGRGRRFIVAVLGDDAKPLTTGRIHEGVPAGLAPAKIAADLAADGIQVLSVQIFPTTGANLVQVLTALSEATGGTFIGWGEGGDYDRSRQVATAVAERLAAVAADTFAQGKRDLAKLEFDSRGNARIPLAGLNGEKLDRLRAAGLRFTIDSGNDGVLTRQGFVLENKDSLEPVIQVDKRTLERLISLFASLGLTTIDVDAMKECVVQALAAIAGEDYDPKENIDVTVKKRLGIQFRTRLLDFNIEYLAGMNRDERLAIAKRIQTAGRELAQFLDVHLDELDRSPAVWMPVAQLP
jgi:hypothetical protein